MDSSLTPPLSQCLGWFPKWDYCTKGYWLTMNPLLCAGARQLWWTHRLQHWCGLALRWGFGWRLWNSTSDSLLKSWEELSASKLVRTPKIGVLLLRNSVLLCSELLRVSALCLIQRTGCCLGGSFLLCKIVSNAHWGHHKEYLQWPQRVLNWK